MKKSAVMAFSVSLFILVLAVPRLFAEGAMTVAPGADAPSGVISTVSPGMSLVPAQDGTGTVKGFGADYTVRNPIPGVQRPVACPQGITSGTCQPLSSQVGFQLQPAMPAPGVHQQSQQNFQQPIQQGQQTPQTQLTPQAQQAEPSAAENGRGKAASAGRAQPAEPVELSAVERMMSADERATEKSRTLSPVTAPLSQYGYNFFKAGADLFAPLTDVPVGPDYLIGAGDRLVLSAWGSIEGNYELDVNRSGEVVLPKVGPVRVQGVSFGNLPKVLRTHLSRVFKDFQLSVTLGRTRLMKVYLVGEVVSPGDYNISSLSTVINALSAAGGPTKGGSLRNIRILRGGSVVETVDLYDFFLKGDKSRDVRLQPGDTLFVPAIGRVAGIAGNVRRPAIYELKDEKSLKELLVLANGFNPAGYLQRLQVIRTIPHDKTEVLDYSLDPKASAASLDKLTSDIAIQDLDLIKVFSIDTTLRGYVRLNGYVLRPGDYALRPGMKMSDLLTADNLLPEYAEGTAELVRLHPPDLHPEVSYFNPAKALAGDPGQNLELKEFDQVRIFSRWDLEEMPRVRVIGEVQRPGDYRLMRNMTVRELVLQAGSPKLTAYLPMADIIRVKRDGESVSTYPVTINLGEAIKGTPQDNIVLEPLDELIVRRIPNWREETERYATIRGEVRFPGTYPIFKGERLTSLIQRAGGYSDKAYLFGAKFTRSSVQKLQQERMDEAIARMERDITFKQQSMAAAASGKEDAAATQLALEGLRKSIDKLKQTRAEGRVALRLEPLEKLKNSPYDLELMGGDTLEIPQSPMAVTVLGEVANPATVIWVPGRDVSFYLAMAGGPTGNAESDEMYVVMANGMVKGKASDGFFGGFMSTTLHPGDAVIVPQKMERISWMKEIKDITQILANLAVTAGVPLAIIKK